MLNTTIWRILALNRREKKIIALTCCPYYLEVESNFRDSIKNIVTLSLRSLVSCSVLHLHYFAIFEWMWSKIVFLFWKKKKNDNVSWIHVFSTAVVTSYGDFEMIANTLPVSKDCNGEISRESLKMFDKKWKKCLISRSTWYPAGTISPHCDKEPHLTTMVEPFYVVTVNYLRDYETMGWCAVNSVSSSGQNVSL